eukprot:scaffold71447_cov33-Cyclotella_meneghiniana.AAC.3
MTVKSRAPSSSNAIHFNQQPTTIDTDNIESQLLTQHTPAITSMSTPNQKHDIARGFNLLILQKAKELDCSTTTNDNDDDDNIILNVEECDVDMLECTIENIRKSVVEDIVCMPRILLDAAIIAREKE